ncbi:MAG: GNAT family N-acetyltransferase [Clostridia bacterium]|nr:GNAT family N-acetyltransferase [Clostridia bacterium]
MIEKITDIGILSGVSSPLLPLLCADFRYSATDVDGAYVQRDNNTVKALASIKNGCATVCVVEDDFSHEEMNSFLSFLHVGQVLSNAPLDDAFKSVALLEITPEPCNSGDLHVTSPTWKLSQYKALYQLLSEGDGSFDSWFTDFSRRVNDGFALGVCSSDYVSCAVAPCVYEKCGIIAGVYTLPQHRGQGLAQDCVNGLLSALNAKGIRVAYLWCNEDKVKFYKKSGFRVIGNLYIREEI